MLALGLLCGVAASVLFNLGIALQAVEARRAPREEGLRVSLLTRLLRRRRWLAGLLLGALGVPLEVLAFANAPFVVVEPLVACGLLVLLAAGTRLLGERPGLDVVLGVTTIILGTALVARGAPPHDEQHRGPVAVVFVIALLVAVSLLPSRRRGPASTTRSSPTSAPPAASPRPTWRRS
jgi:drug/metabolite transporter (DMT)-like permease